MEQMMLLKQGTIHDAIQEEAFKADILIADGKIKKLPRCWKEKSSMRRKSLMPPESMCIRALWRPTAIWGWTAMASVLRDRTITR